MKRRGIFGVTLATVLVLIASTGISTPFIATAADHGLDRSSGDMSEDPSSGAAPVRMAVGGTCEPEFEITAASCSVSDIRSAVDAVKTAGAGTVHIPAGTCDHGGENISLPDGIRFIGAGQDKTIISNAMIRVDGRSNKLNGSLRISELYLAYSSRLEIRACEGFRVDHITIESSSGTAISVLESRSSVIDHNTIKVTGSYYGVLVSQGYEEVYPDDWVTNTEDLLGSPTAIFIEDNNFYGSHHSVIGHGNAHYVARHNTFQGNNAHVIDAHGPGFGPPCGTRLVEVYDNELNLSPDYTWKAFGIRGGSAVIFNNVINDYDNGILLTLESRANEYPAEMRVHDVWIWNNTFNNLGYGNEHLCPGDYLAGNPHCNEVFVWNISVHPGLDSLTEIQEDSEFFLRAPSQELDGFTYTPYIYPHPLTQELTLTGTPGNQTIHLDWEMCASLPVSGTWQIAYDGTPGLPVSPVTGIVSHTRSYSLTQMTNYEPYTITLYAMVDTTPILSDTVCVMPTDILVHLPLVMREP